MGHERNALRARLGRVAVGIVSAVAVLGVVAAGAAAPASAAAPTRHTTFVDTTTLPVGRWAEIHNSNSEQCLAVGGASTAGGAGVIQWGCDGGLEQQWTLTNPIYDINNVPWYRVVNLHSGLCLADPASSLSQGTQLIQYGCIGGREQRWGIGEDSSGTRLISLLNYYCAAVGGGSGTQGAPVVQWGCYDPGLEQQWY